MLIEPGLAMASGGVFGRGGLLDDIAHRRKAMAILETWFSKRRWQYVRDHPFVFASLLILVFLGYLLKHR
jgi:hypothetical protein